MSLDTSVYGKWGRIAEQMMSKDGQWVLYRAEQDYVLVDAPAGKTYELKNMIQPAFFANGKWLKYTAVANDKSKTDTVVLRCLKNGNAIHWFRKQAFRESTNAPYIYYSTVSGNTQQLTVSNIESGDSVLFSDVTQYLLYNKDQSIIYAQVENGKTVLKAGDIWGKKKIIYKGEAGRLLTFSLNKGEKYGNFTVAYTNATGNKADQLFCFRLATGNYTKILDANDVKLPKGFRLGNLLYDVPENTGEIELNIIAENASRPVGESKNTELVDAANLEIWRWDETTEERRQKKTVRRSAPLKLPRFIYHRKTRNCVQVAPAETERMILPTAASFDFGFIIDSKPYVYELDWKYTSNFDLYLVNLHTAEVTKLVTNACTYPEWSPSGKYAVWYDAQQREWVKIEPVTGKLENISAAIGFPVYDEDYDMPKPAGPYGIAAWTKDGNGVILYDRYDMWVIDLAGSKQTYCLTGQEGRRKKIRFRWLKADFMDQPFVLENQLLKSFNEETKAKGIYRLSGRGIPVKLIDTTANVTIKDVSVDGKTFLWTCQTAAVFPDLWWSSDYFSKPHRLTNINSHQPDYLWIKAKLVQWTNFDGTINEGVLYVPENYDSSKLYPMIVNFYERHTDNLFDYLTPGYSTSTIDIPTYVSNGYLVFRPDVHFKKGHPGESAYNAVVSGTQELIKRGIADKKRIGLQGHSWGGYEVAYLLTRTSLFACANTGAAVVNMPASYTALRGNGTPRMFMYETGQGRIGESLWENKEAYLTNSPLFNVDKIASPLLIFHCDHDEAVSYAEGMSFFLSMRRLGKPAWLFNYKNEGHTLATRPSQQDWTLRQRQFFDFDLKGIKPPAWIGTN